MDTFFETLSRWQVVKELTSTVWCLAVAHSDRHRLHPRRLELELLMLFPNLRKRWEDHYQSEGLSYEEYLGVMAVTIRVEDWRQHQSQWEPGLAIAEDTWWSQSSSSVRSSDYGGSSSMLEHMHLGSPPPVLSPSFSSRWTDRLPQTLTSRAANPPP